MLIRMMVQLGAVEHCSTLAVDDVLVADAVVTFVELDYMYLHKQLVAIDVE